jgi:hypothetical protein
LFGLVIDTSLHKWTNSRGDLLRVAGTVIPGNFPTLGGRTRHCGELIGEMTSVISGRGLSNDHAFVSFREEIDPSGRYPEMPMSHSDPNPSVEFLRSGPTLSYDIFVFRFYEVAIRDCRQSAKSKR